MEKVRKIRSFNEVRKFGQQNLNRKPRNRGSNMGTHVLCNLLKELRNKDKMRGFVKYLIIFLQRFMQDSMFH